MHRLLIVDDDAQLRAFCRMALNHQGLLCEEAEDGAQGLALLRRQPCDLILLDVDLPGLAGPDVCRRLRENPPCPHFKIIMVSGHASNDDMAAIMLAGADDFLAKPFSVLQLLARVKTALRLKEAQDRSDALNLHLLAVNRELEQGLSARNSDLTQARNALVLALAHLVKCRDEETGAHLRRLQQYCRCLAESATAVPVFAAQLDTNFVEMLECLRPLHDIGKAGLPDHILLKPGALTVEERTIMQTHTTIGSGTLVKVARQHGFARAFLQMAIEITRHHHERYDGTGYPDRLIGDNIPLSARIVALADVYDALRSRRVYKPALSHATAIEMMENEFQGHFDPALAQVFRRCEASFAQTYLSFGEV